MRQRNLQEILHKEEEVKQVSMKTYNLKSIVSKKEISKNCQENSKTKTRNLPNKVK